jgi:pilus assembly protein CpaB
LAIYWFREYVFSGEIEMNRRNITIAVVAILALGAGLVVYGLLTQPHKQAPPPRTVVVSTMRIPEHAHIVPAMLDVVQKPAEEATPDALSNTGDAVGMVATSDIPEGTQITPGELAKLATPPPPALVVPKGMRAVTIPIDQVKGVAGLLRPGDRVDVIAIPPRSAGTPMAYTILRDVNVLAVGQATWTVQPEVVPSAAPGAAATPPAAFVQPATATLAVTPAEADLLASADVNAILRLALRPQGEPARSTTAETLIYPTPLPVATPVAPAAAPRGPTGIPVINGDVVAGPTK